MLYKRGFCILLRTAASSSSPTISSRNRSKRYRSLPKRSIMAETGGKSNQCIYCTVRFSLTFFRSTSTLCFVVLLWFTLFTYSPRSRSITCFPVVFSVRGDATNASQRGDILLLAPGLVHLYYVHSRSIGCLIDPGFFFLPFFLAQSQPLRAPSSCEFYFTFSYSVAQYHRLFVLD